MTSITSSHHPQTESEVTIAVTEVIGDTVCIASGDGQKVFERIAAALKQGKKVTVSFKDAEDITPAFLADAIGQLYHEFPEEPIRASLNIVDMEPDDAEILKYTIHWTKEYLKDPQRFMAAAREAFGEDYE